MRGVCESDGQGKGNLEPGVQMTTTLLCYLPWQIMQDGKGTRKQHFCEGRA